MIIRKDQNGLVSIMVASVLMVIMALITLGFTRLVQNEQRQALDSQLSKQAFYAAESGINMAASAPGFPGAGRKTCNMSEYNNGIISAESPDVAVTCILIDPTPPSLVFGNDSITTNKSKVVPIKTNQPPTTITFSWKDYNNSGVETSCNTITDFDIDADNWGKISPLKVDLIGIPNGNFNRDSLVSTQFNAIFYPCSGTVPTSVDYATAMGQEDIGRIIPVSCQIPVATSEYPCQVKITNVIGAQREFYTRFNSIYSEINVEITANRNNGDRLLFSSAQAVVDSTGRAKDVLQRLQARVPLYDNYTLPSATIQTLEDICKRYDVQATQVVDKCSP